MHIGGREEGDSPWTGLQFVIGHTPFTLTWGQFRFFNWLQCIFMGLPTPRADSEVTALTPRLSLLLQQIVINRVNL